MKHGLWFISTTDPAWEHRALAYRGQRHLELSHGSWHIECIVMH